MKQLIFLFVIPNFFLIQVSPHGKRH